MEHPNIDIQWGNHDISLAGAAAGSPACIFTVLRISLDYGNANLTLERRYGISPSPLYDFTRKYVCEAPKKKRQYRVGSHRLLKLEGRGHRARHPGCRNELRLMLNHCDF